MEVRSQSRSGLADGPANAVLSELVRPGRSFTALIEGQLRVNLTHPRRRRRPTGICALLSSVASSRAATILEAVTGASARLALLALAAQCQ